jgi:hypothetical protein
MCHHTIAGIALATAVLVRCNIICLVGIMDAAPAATPELGFSLQR